MIKNIQILRFFAAMAVVIHHAIPPVFNSQAYANLGPAWRFLVEMSFIGVDIFFVISGTIMAHSIRKLPLQHRFGQTARRFFLHRLVRIYAGWWPFFIIYAVAYVALGSRNEKNLLNSFFLIPQSLSLNLLPITWTLSFELYFYTVLAFLLFFPVRILKPAILIGALLVGASTIYFFVNDLYKPQRFGDVTLLHEFFLFPLTIEFAAGFLVYHFVMKNQRSSLWPWVAIAVVFGMLASYYQLTANFLHPSGMAGFHYAPQRALLVGGASTGLVACALLLPSSDKWFMNVLAKLGDASYATYLGHIAVLSALSILVVRFTHVTSLPLPFYPFALIAVLAYSWLHYFWIERPLYGWMKRSLSAD